jgi:hypothetical protein
MDEAEKAILRVLNNPKLTSGEKAAAVKRMTGTAPHPAGPGMADIKRTTRGAMKGSSRKAFYGIDRP